MHNKNLQGKEESTTDDESDLVSDDMARGKGGHRMETTPRPDRGCSMSGTVFNQMGSATEADFQSQKVRLRFEKTVALHDVPPPGYRGSPHPTVSVSDSSSTETDDGLKKKRKRKRRSSSSGRGSDDLNKAKDDRIKDLEIELKEQQVKFYTRLNRDYDKIMSLFTKPDNNQWLLSSVAGQIGGIRSLLESSTFAPRK